jgi:hypothetical protein
MSNYVKATDFAAKDALSTGNPLKLIKGTEINDELNAIQTALATKADLASPAFTGNPTASTQAFGNNTTRLATTAFVQTALALLYLPVGSIHISVVSTNPATTLGYGTWVSFGAGRVLVGLNAADASFDTVEETGGSKDAVVVSHTHTATVTDPGHTHSPVTSNNGFTTASSTTPFNRVGETWSTPTGTSLNNNVAIASATTGITVANSTEGVSGTNANLQPYIVVYMWKRTA